MEEILQVHADHRGKLFKAFDAGEGQVFVITLEAGKTRGNHYHKRKVERFTIAQGECEINSRNQFTNRVQTFRLNADHPRTVSIYPDAVHNIYSEHGCVIVCWVSEKFDESDPDTYPEEV